MRFTPMPAYLAAWGLAPTVRTSKPKVVRREDEPHQHAQADGDEEPEVERAGRCEMTSGSRAEAGSGSRAGHRGAVSRRITGSCEFTIQRTKSTAMLLSMIVMITSCAPVLALSTPGMPP